MSLMAAGFERSTVRQRPKSAGLSLLMSRTEVLAEDDDLLRKKGGRSYLTAKHYAQLGVYYLVLVCLAYFVHSRLPSALKISDENSGYRGRFIEERARGHLRALTTMGPRATGSYENEVLCVDFLLRELDFIRQRSKDAHVVTIETQKPSGSFNLDFQDKFTSCYAKVTNILVKLEPKRGAESSMMVNCHFDSVPGSPGASDDAVSCAIMLEVLHIISQSEEPLTHSVIFSFNGAEENILQASHGFITQHPWAKSIRAFINLDSCGSGGQELLFQAGPENPWLIELYGKAAKYPFACILAQEIFQSGVIPGDTDYRIFRDYGKIPGLDIAYIKNGYIYHTKFDREEFIPPGTIQRAGENVLGLVKEMAVSPLLTNPGQQQYGTAIYFDFFGLFLVVYSEWVGQLGILVSFAMVMARTVRMCANSHKYGFNSGRHYLKALAIGVAIVWLSWILSLVAAIVVAVSLGILGGTMSWFTRPYLCVPLYVFPILLMDCTVHRILEGRLYKEVNDPWRREQLSFAAIQAFWLVLVLFLALCGIKTSMVFVIGIIMPSVVRWIGNKCVLPHSKDYARDYLYINMVAHSLHVELGAQAAVVAIEMFIPVLGRTGATVQPDIFVAALVWGSYQLCCATTIPIVHPTKALKTVLMWVFGGFIVVYIAATLTPIGHPYSGDPKQPSPQRFIVTHVQRTLHARNGDVRQEDSGIWVLPVDYNGARDMYKYLPEAANAVHVDDVCKKELMCGMPFYYPALERLTGSIYIEGPPPKYPIPARLRLVSQSPLDMNVRRLTFNVTGPDHMAVYMSTATDIEAVRWSFADGKPYQTSSVNGLPSYFVYFSYGESPGYWIFWIDLKVPHSHNKSSPMLHVALTGHHLSAKSPELDSINQRLPEWVYSATWVATYQNWMF